MLNRNAARILVLTLAIISLFLMSGCSSKPNPDLSLGGIDIEEVFNGQIARVGQILAGISSTGSLDSAHDELQVVSTNFDDLIFNSAKLSENGQMALSVLAMREAPEVERLVAQVKGSPVMDEKLGGVMDGILARIKQLI